MWAKDFRSLCADAVRHQLDVTLGQSYRTLGLSAVHTAEAAGVRSGPWNGAAPSPADVDACLRIVRGLQDFFTNRETPPRAERIRHDLPTTRPG